MAACDSRFAGKKRATVPELYRKAAKVLKSAEQRKESVKNLIYSSGFRDIKPLYALVAESVKHENTLERLIERTGLKELQPPVDSHLLKVLVTELLWGKGYLKPENARAIKIVLNVKQELESFSKDADSGGIDNGGSEISVPRYVRVNTLKGPVSRVVSQFISEGWRQLKLSKDASYSDFIKTVANLKEDEFLIDFHLDFLLVFSSNTQLHDHFLLHDGFILLQDKASCLSAVALSTESDGKIIDACAAPGMKTSLLAALSHKKRHIVAVERDAKRCNVLRQTLRNCGAANVRVLNEDFLNIDPSQHDDVEYILVDPSCSGSGIVKRFEPLDKGGDEMDLKIRLRKLSALQCRLLEHAASFSNVRRIVYSTCSVHVEENERIVEKTLGTIGHMFQLERVLPQWSGRGLDECDKQHTIGDNCVRVDAERDLTNGFFVASFIRCKN